MSRREKGVRFPFEVAPEYPEGRSGPVEVRAMTAADWARYGPVCPPRLLPGQAAPRMAAGIDATVQALWAAGWQVGAIARHLKLERRSVNAIVAQGRADHG